MILCILIFHLISDIDQETGPFFCRLCHSNAWRARLSMKVGRLSQVGAASNSRLNYFGNFVFYKLFFSRLGYLGITPTLRTNKRAM